MTIEAEQLEFIERNKELISSMMYIEKYEIKDLKLINKFTQDLQYRIQKNREKEFVSEICNSDKKLLNNFIDNFIINYDVYKDIARALDIDNMIAYTKCYFNSFTMKEKIKIGNTYYIEFIWYLENEGIKLEGVL